MVHDLERDWPDESMALGMEITEVGDWGKEK
jgi:hypothetical protein